MSKKYEDWIPEYLAGYLEPVKEIEFQEELLKNEDLQNTLRKTEISLEKYAQSTSDASPEESLKESIWNKISESDETNSHNEVEYGYLTNTKSFSIGSLLNSYVGIAASVLLLLSLIGNIYFANEAKYQKNNFLSTLEEKTLLQEELNELNSSSKLFSQEVALLKNPNMKVCKLISQNKDQSNSLLLAIDMSNDMQVAVMSPDLPQKPIGHSYQLWAISPSGEMVCMGTFDAEKKIYTMKNLPFIPEEFGVTIEEGELGQPQPTSDFLVRGI